MIKSGESKVWIEVVKADDLDAHMAQNGQAQANAKLISQMLKDFPLKPLSRILIPGCGTGQMFDYLDPNELNRYDITFSDINDEFLKCLINRLSQNAEIKYNSVNDDIENSKLTGSYDGILSVLLLEHIDWRKGLDCIFRLKPLYLYFVIQAQEPGTEILDHNKVLRPTIAQFAKISKMKLIQKSELKVFLAERGFRKLKEYVKDVPDNKKMIGLVFGC